MGKAIIIAVVSGVVLNILWEAIKIRIINPQMQFGHIKGKIYYILIQYANVFSNPQKAVYVKDYDMNMNKLIHSELHDKATQDTRQIASELISFSENWVGYRPSKYSKDKLETVMRDLIGLSNNVYYTMDESQVRDQNATWIKEIKDILGFSNEKTASL